MSNRRKNTRPKNAARRKRTLFVRTYLISTTVLLILLVSGGMYLYSWVKPPEIIPPADDAYHEPASVPLHGDEEDRYVGAIIGGVKNDTGKKENFYTFLIFGTDNVGYNTDTLMVASYDGAKKEANVISIPRDSLVNVKRTVKKINAAYGAGTINGGGHEGGVDQLKREIKTIVGFEPDYYVMVDLKAFIEIVDAVGGINIDNPYFMKYDDRWQNLHIYFAKGPLYLDGANALKYVRYRQNNELLADGTYRITSEIGDFKRIENQQMVINTILKKVLEPQNIVKIPQYIDIFNDNVRTNLKMENMIWFAGQINEIRGTQALSMYTMPTSGAINQRGWYALLDEEGILELVNKTINPYTHDITSSDVDIITSPP